MLIRILLLAGSLTQLPPEATLHVYVEDATYADERSARLLEKTYAVAALQARDFTVEFPLQELQVDWRAETRLLLRAHLSLVGDETAFRSGDYLSKQPHEISQSELEADGRAIDTVTLELSEI